VQFAARVASVSRQHYRRFIHTDVEFYAWFQAVTPIDVITRMQIGSRPAVRPGKEGFDALRAVPWVFAWTQSRHLLPGWYGAGFGLRTAIDELGLAVARAAYAEWPFFSTLVDDLESLLAGGTPKAVCVVIDPEDAARCLQEMSAHLDGSARVTQSRTEYVEIVSPMVNKASACEFVCARLGLTMKDVVAIGDAPNDIEMLDAAGYAVAVSTARADVIAHADATCAPPQDAGVADVLAALDLV